MVKLTYFHQYLETIPGVLGWRSPEVLAHGDVDEGVDDRVDEGEEKEDNAVVIHRVRELQEAQLQQSLHYKPKNILVPSPPPPSKKKVIYLGPQHSRKRATTRSNILMI